MMNLHWHVIITQSRQFILRLHLGVVRSKNFVKCILQQIVGSHKVFVLPIYLSSTSVIIKKNLIVSKKKQKRSGIWHKYSGFPIPCCCCSVTQSYPTLCNLMDCSRPDLPVLHYLPELPQTHVHWIGNAIQPSCPVSSPSPPAFYLSQHQCLF